ncbi:MAG: putative toxin-antitoxin system toxin component, PIN family [Pseudomonadota bacterium]|nr:putative toxin-antitoxin system toxin component, PIN family [Pseudomonadota bacterium]
MHIVADTNTALSGLLWGGPPRRLIDLARERSLILCTSFILLAELAEVIARDKFAQRIQLAGLSAADLVQDYRRHQGTTRGPTSRRNLSYLVIGLFNA